MTHLCSGDKEKYENKQDKGNVINNLMSVCFYITCSNE